MGFKKQKKHIFSNFFLSTKLIILFELLAYERTTFEQNFIKFSSKTIENWAVELAFRDPLEKSILAVARITRDNFIWNQKIKYFLLVGEYSTWLNEGFLKNLKFDFLAQL